MTNEDTEKILDFLIDLLSKDAANLIIEDYNEITDKNVIIVNKENKSPMKFRQMRPEERLAVLLQLLITYLLTPIYLRESMQMLGCKELSVEDDRLAGISNQELDDYQNALVSLQKIIKEMGLELPELA